MKKLYSLLLVFAAAAAAPAGIKLQTASPSGDAELYRLSKAVEAKLGELHKAAEFPGVTVGFALPDGRSASVSAGLADLERKTPLAPKDRMLAGSIGKTFAAAVTLQLVAEGRLNLDDPLEKWFGREPWFARLPNARDITLRMLMNHTSGIPEHVLDEKFIEALRANPDRVWRPEELIAYVFDKKPLFAAGKGWSYADTNYILVGMVFERVSGKKLYSEVARRILKPLALSDTIPSDRRALPGVITGYSRPDSPFKFTGRVIVDGKFVANPQMEWTGGGFASTAGDLARWAKALYEGRVLGKRELEQMLAGVDATGGRGAGGSYGLAVQIRNSEWGRSYGHGGWFPGYLSEMEYFPEKRIAVAIQFNTDNVRQLKRGPRAYIAEVMRIILGEAAMKKAA
ncbi:MAG TPA: serine hydrolase domain-containing protein [Blastocatellia bacterium]